MKTALYRIACFVAIVAAAGLCDAARAQMTGDTIKVGGRAASFLQPRLAGTVTAAIIYEPGNEASEREARVIERELASGAGADSLRFRPRRVASNALDELDGVRIAFVTRGTPYRQIAAATAPRSILTISSDSACARAAYCTMAVQSSPRIQIVVSRAAASAARIRFSSSFLMLVKEI
ncbi:MAG TPA: YfiR/HmsC family protein [Croceibacterium sp.]